MRQYWNHDSFRDLIRFTGGNIHEFRMHFMEFADIRKFGRDHLDIVDGTTFYIYNILVSCDRTTEKDLLLAMDDSGDVMSHAMKREYLEGEEPFTFHHGCPAHGQYPDCGSCLVQRIMQQ